MSSTCRRIAWPWTSGGLHHAGGVLWLKGVILVVLILGGWHGGGCAVASQREGPGVAVRRVDYGGAPELAGLAEEARGFANAMYPRVCALFLDGEAEAPRHFDLILRPIPGGNQGEAHIHRGSIHLDSVSLTNGPLQAERLRHLLVHEMAHLATVRSPGWRRWWSSPDPDARAWQESLAEFACFKLLEGVGPGCAQCDARLPTYADGYECGGAFLLFLDGRHGTNLVRQLVGVLRRKSFDEEFFLRATGSPLDQLWADFRKTAAFLPSAQEALELREALGYVEGRPPRDVRKRFRRLVAERGDPFTRQAMATVVLPGRSNRQIGLRELVVLYTYLMQPGGPPERFLFGLRDGGQLPGVPATATAWSPSMASFEAMATRRYPEARVVVGRFEGDPSGSTYHYAVRRTSVEAPWVLERAWRTDAGGKVVEEYSCR